MDSSRQSKLVKKILDVCVEPVAFVVLFFVILNRIIIGGGWINITHSTIEKVFMEYILWMLDGALFLWIASQKKNLPEYLILWKRNWILLGFILFAISSMFWSENIIVSLYKVFVLVACSLIAAYIGITYSCNLILRKLMWYFAIIACLSYVLALLIPAAGTHIGYPYFGAWRGLFFHKNYLGTIMSFATTVLLFLIIAEKKINNQIIYFCLFLITAGLVYFSRSATGIILFVTLNAGLLLAYVWIKWKNHLRRSHYIALGIIFAVVVILALSNLDFLFGLLNKDTTLTGRLPLWSFLINNGMINHPWFGSGFGATWASDQFRRITQAADGWGFASLSSDNGLVDIYLHLGLVGILLLISSVILFVYRVTRYALREQTLISFLPAIIMVFIIIANISVSFFLEFESLGWFLMVFALFATTPLPHANQAEPEIT
ncbi:MAG: hypothetical protein A2X25_02210 [Chloroflexi bacterium GWB2_49_20]|nr:MAG: hypothetical protein A2X25_02210 [Chloroflexi bacterium GWB2_49_20]OGN78258.1 MAG: hypothetical protein A2X26_14815 [Chloroflexi bacterium GWC2_49_37]OGN85294.1 MAG: hypothetical protein A2X27_07470 [Chloroflexi bacterium GWD2_49_16]